MVNSKATITEPLMLKELLAYQNSSVVSRTMMDEDDGTVTAYAFDENKGLSEHT